MASGRKRQPVQRHRRRPARTTSRRCSAAARAARALRRRIVRARPASAARRRRRRRTARAPRARPRRGARRGGRARRGRGRRRRSAAPGSNPSSALPDGVPHEDGGRVEAEHVAQSVVLALVEFVGDERRRSGRGASSCGRSRRCGRARPIRMSFGPGDGDGLGGLEGGEQRRRARRAPARCPRRAARARRRRTRVRRAPARPRAPPRRTRARCCSSTTWVAPAAATCSRASASACGEHDDERVGRAHLRSDRVEGAPEVVAAVTNDEDGGDSGEHRGQPRRPLPRHPQRAGRASKPIGDRSPGAARRARRDVARRVGPNGSDRALAQLATLALGEPAPDAEALVVRERVLEALRRAPRIRCRSSSRRASIRPSQGRTPRDRSARTVRRSAMPADCRRLAPGRTPGTPSLTGSTNQSSGTPERYSGLPISSPTQLYRPAREGVS